MLLIHNKKRNILLFVIESGSLFIGWCRSLKFCSILFCMQGYFHFSLIKYPFFTTFFKAMILELWGIIFENDSND